jgi:hypothetical protein
MQGHAAGLNDPTLDLRARRNTNRHHRGVAPDDLLIHKRSGGAARAKEITEYSKDLVPIISD